MPTNQGGMQYDERGRPYFLMANGQRSYVSPVAMGGSAPADETSILRSRPQWNQHTGEWETPIDWGNIANIGVGTLLTAGAANAFLPGAAAAGAGGAGGASHGIPLLSGTLPGASANGLIGGAGAAAGAGSLPMAGTLASRSILPANSMINATVPGAQQLNNFGLGGNGFDWKKLLPGGGGNNQQSGGNSLAALIPLLIHFLSGGGGPSDQQNQIQDLTMRRMNAQNPLFEAASRLAFDRLPTNATQGLERPTLGQPKGR